MPHSSRSSSPCTPSMIPIWLTVWNAADSAARPARRRWLAVHLSICCMCLVPTADDPVMVGWHAPVVGGHSVEPRCHPKNSLIGLPDAVRRLRRGLRDVRDRMARRSRPWHAVCCAGMAGGDGTALVMITHEDIERCEVKDALRRRWPDVALKELGQKQPTVAMLPADAADLGRCRRGVEPLRIVIMPQHYRQVATPAIG